VVCAGSHYPPRQFPPTHAPLAKHSHDVNTTTHHPSYQTDTKKISAVSIFFETFPYRLNESTGLIDYDRMEENAALFR
jgi:glycine/serine hydroxymethyltransferase